MAGESDLFHAVGNHLETWQATDFPNVSRRAQFPGEVPLLVNASKALKQKIVTDPKNPNAYLFQIDHNDLETWHGLCLPGNVDAIVRGHGATTQYFTALQTVVDHLKEARTLALANLLLGNTTTIKSPQDVIFHTMGEILEKTGADTISEANHINDEILELAQTQDAQQSVEIFKDSYSFLDRVESLKARAALEPPDANGDTPTLSEFVDRLRTLQEDGHEDRVRDVVAGTLRALPDDSVEAWTLEAAEQAAGEEREEEPEEHGP